jgi:hypothetical protein
MEMTNNVKAPPEIRGSLVAVQQLAITFGIMISFWVCCVRFCEISQS